MCLPQISKIAGEEWKNMTEEQKAPYEEVQLESFFFFCLIWIILMLLLVYAQVAFPQIAKKLKENYNQEMELYKQKKTEVWN